MTVDYSNVTAIQTGWGCDSVPDRCCACYNSDSGRITLARDSVIGNFLETGSIIKTLNHENMHKVLEESMRETNASWRYDDAFGDYPVHDIDDVYHDATDEDDWRKIA